LARRSTQGGVPHTALVYSDWHDRNQLIDSCLNRAGIRWWVPTVLSVRPEIDRRFFEKMTKKAAARRHPPQPSVYDARRISSGSRDPTEEVLSIFKDALKQSSGSSAPMLIGDWGHLRYDNFETILNLERRLEEESLSPICCYRNEGFCSLDPKQIIGVLETHRKTFFGSTKFEVAA
jgi:hypothetical protein